MNDRAWVAIRKGRVELRRKALNWLVQRVSFLEPAADSRRALRLKAQSRHQD